jgi:hypothetical protein
MGKNIPEPPISEHIPDKVKKQLEFWIQYFKNLSPRVYIYQPTNRDLQILYDRVYEKLKDSTEKPVRDWPKHSAVAFIVAVDLSPVYDPAHPRIELENTYVFCFNDYAFGCDYFELLCYEEPPCDLVEPHTFGLQGYSEKALSWNYIAKCIRNKITELQNQVPILKKN